jgi:hypothetical protein
MNGENPPPVELRAADVDAFANRLNSRDGSANLTYAHYFFRNKGYNPRGLNQAIRNLEVLQPHRFRRIGQNIVLLEVGLCRYFSSNIRP